MYSGHSKIIHPACCAGSGCSGACSRGCAACSRKGRGRNAAKQGEKPLGTIWKRRQKRHEEEHMKDKPEVILHTGRQVLSEKPFGCEHETNKNCNKKIADKKSGEKAGQISLLLLWIGRRAGCAVHQYRTRLIYRVPDRRIPWQ